MNSIAHDYENSKYISERIFRFFKVCGLSEILQKSNAYKEKGISLIDIGTSTVDGVPNFGLCDFKESIGCNCSPKINFVKEIV